MSDERAGLEQSERPLPPLATLKLVPPPASAKLAIVNGEKR
jgi:hypothetical protein